MFEHTLSVKSSFRRDDHKTPLTTDDVATDGRTIIVVGTALMMFFSDRDYNWMIDDTCACLFLFPSSSFFVLLFFFFFFIRKIVSAHTPHHTIQHNNNKTKKKRRRTLLLLLLLKKKKKEGKKKKNDEAEAPFF